MKDSHRPYGAAQVFSMAFPRTSRFARRPGLFSFHPYGVVEQDATVNARNYEGRPSGWPSLLGGSGMAGSCRRSRGNERSDEASSLRDSLSHRVRSFPLPHPKKKRSFLGGPGDARG
jgi:hypothetical protein